MTGSLFDPLGCALEIEEGTSATRAGNKFSFGDSGTGSLEQIIGKSAVTIEFTGVFDRKDFTNPVAEE